MFTRAYHRFGAGAKHVRASVLVAGFGVGEGAISPLPAVHRGATAGGRRRLGGLLGASAAFLAASTCIWRAASAAARPAPPAPGTRGSASAPASPAAAPGRPPARTGRGTAERPLAVPLVAHQQHAARQVDLGELPARQPLGRGVGRQGLVRLAAVALRRCRAPAGPARWRGRRPAPWPPATAPRPSAPPSPPPRGGRRGPPPARAGAPAPSSTAPPRRRGRPAWPAAGRRGRPPRRRRGRSSAAAAPPAWPGRDRPGPAPRGPWSCGRPPRPGSRSSASRAWCQASSSWPDCTVERRQPLARDRVVGEVAGRRVVGGLGAPQVAGLLQQDAEVDGRLLERLAGQGLLVLGAGLGVAPLALQGDAEVVVGLGRARWRRARPASAAPGWPSRRPWPSPSPRGSPPPRRRAGAPAPRAARPGRAGLEAAARAGFSAGAGATGALAQAASASAEGRGRGFWRRGHWSRSSSSPFFGRGSGSSGAGRGRRLLLLALGAGPGAALAGAAA